MWTRAAECSKLTLATGRDSSRTLVFPWHLIWPLSMPKQHQILSDIPRKSLHPLAQLILGQPSVPAYPPSFLASLPAASVHPSCPLFLPPASFPQSQRAGCWQAVRQTDTLRTQVGIFQTAHVVLTVKEFVSLELLLFLPSSVVPWGAPWPSAGPRSLTNSRARTLLASLLLPSFYWPVVFPNHSPSSFLDWRRVKREMNDFPPSGCLSFLPFTPESPKARFPSRIAEEWEEPRLCQEQTAIDLNPGSAIAAGAALGESLLSGLQFLLCKMRVG